MHKILTSLLVLAALTAPHSAVAEKIKYYQDPVYQKLNGSDPHPMNDLIGLAEEDDVRAQFILADLYAKGKGGLSKNEKKAAYWFEQSARRGYNPSFIRLAALAKRRGKNIDAYQWYTLAIEQFRSGKDQKYAVKARNDLAAEAKLTPAQIKEARKAADDWKVERVREDRERQARRKAEKEAAILEKPKKSNKPAVKEEENTRKEIKVNE